MFLKTLLLLSLSTITYAAESDNFYSFKYDIPEANNEINLLAQEHLEVALKRANHTNGCNKKNLYKELRKKFANHTKGEFIIDLINNHPHLFVKTPIENSIYYNWKSSDGLSLGLKKKVKGDLTLSPLVKINNQIIGIDKIEHMFGMGYHYYNNYYENNLSLDKVLRTGSGFEKFVLGGSFYATGIFSYGDLSANFNGMRFWNNMLGENNDILGSSYQIEPYIKCSNNKWISNKASPIDFSHYVDQSMDESTNCSKFARLKAAHKIAYNIQELKRSTGLDYCHERKDIFFNLHVKYKKLNISSYILNNYGIRKFSYKKDI